MIRPVLLAGVGLTLFALGGCAANRAVVDPKGVSMFRQYGFDTTVPDPQPVWNPGSYLIAARSAEGFALLQEGTGRQEYFASQEGRESHDLAWINQQQFIFGPKTNVIQLTDGRVVGATEGLTVVDVIDDGVRTNATRTPLTDRGFRPRPDGDTVYCQIEDSMMVVDRRGALNDAGKGFYPEPQPQGQGIAWQEQPVVEPDYWSATPGQGNLIIRWRPGRITTVKGGVQARWVGNGLVCTQLRGDPIAGKPWWSVGTDVVYIPGEGREGYVIAKDARDPDPHPSEPLVAVTDATGGTRIVSRRAPPLPASNRITTLGEKPKWSSDGTRILTEEGSARNTKKLVVYVLKLQRSGPVEE